MHLSFPIEIGLGEFDIRLIEARPFHYRTRNGEGGLFRTNAPYHFYSLILKGANRVKIEGINHEYEANANSALLLKQGEFFTAEFETRCDLEVINVFFELDTAVNAEVLDWLPRIIDGKFGIEHFRESAVGCAMAVTEGRPVLAKLNFALLLLEAARLKVEAESSGFSRTCKNALVYIQTNHRERCHRDEIACACGVTPNYLSNLMKTETGKTLAEQVDHATVEKAKELIQTTSFNFSQIADTLGLDPFRFSKIFKRVTGMTPSAYAKTSFARTVVGGK